MSDYGSENDCDCAFGSWGEINNQASNWEKTIDRDLALAEAAESAKDVQDKQAYSDKTSDLDKTTESKLYTTEKSGDNVKIVLNVSHPNYENFLSILSHFSDCDTLYNFRPYIMADNLYDNLDAFQRKADNGESDLVELVAFLNEHFKEKTQTIENMLSLSKIDFRNLNKFFKKDDHIMTTYRGKKVGGTITYTETYPLNSGKKCFSVNYQVITSTGSKLVYATHNSKIVEYLGVKDINSFDIAKLDDETRHYLTERGKIYRKYAFGTSYKRCTGIMQYKTCYGIVNFRAQGRIMIDINGFDQFNPNYQSSRTDSDVNDMSDDILFLCSPFIFGFSFLAKRWGEIDLETIEDIVFDDHAFDQLVLEKRIKHLSKSLVMNIDHGFKDIVSEKSGGCIFLLHGPPGVGKTLTCEAISEHLHKPLYSITVGELGTEPHYLEKNLVRILEIADSWKAVILIDEADVFMEKRTTKDIIRNAMVGIFLRLLERFQGIMFLTTNRAAELDDAFRSRISMIIPYTNFDLDTRLKVWKSLLTVANVQMSDSDIHNLATKYDINGRQIKNAIRLVQCMQHDETTDTELTMKSTFEYFNYVIKMI